MRTYILLVISLLFCSCEGELEKKAKATLFDSARVHNLEIVYLERPEPYSRADSVALLRKHVLNYTFMRKACSSFDTYSKEDATSDSLARLARDSFFTLVLKTQLGQDSSEIQGYWTYVSFKDTNDNKWDYQVYFDKEMKLVSFLGMNW